MKNLTLRYSITQFSYWAASTGAASFAATCLLEKGLPSGSVGLLLAAAGILACLTNPVLASIADRSKKHILPRLMLVLSALCVLCFALQFFRGLPILAAGVL